MTILWFLADAFARAIVAPGVARAVLGERISLGGAWTAMRARFWQILGLYGIAAAVTIVPLTLFVVLIAVAAADHSGIALAVVLVIGIPVMLAWALLYGVGMGVSVPVVVLERGGIIASVRRAIRLLRGRFWWTVLIGFVAGVLINIATTILQYAGQFVGFIGIAVAPQNEALGIAIFALFYAFAYLVSAVILYSYMGAVYTFVYIDLRIRHVGFDVDLAEAAEERARGASRV
jgi:hypothetical protein